jgi:hypothetical protein
VHIEDTKKSINKLNYSNELICQSEKDEKNQLNIKKKNMKSSHKMNQRNDDIFKDL